MNYIITVEHEGINPAVIGRVWKGREVAESDFTDPLQFALWIERGWLVPVNAASKAAPPAKED